MKNISQKIIDNVANITNEQKKQVSNCQSIKFHTSLISSYLWLQHLALRQLAEGNVTGGGGGDDDFAVNWFELVTRKHMDELGLLIKAASKCLYPPPKGHGSQRQNKDGK